MPDAQNPLLPVARTAADVDVDSAAMGNMARECRSARLRAIPSTVADDDWGDTLGPTRHHRPR